MKWLIIVVVLMSSCRTNRVNIYDRRGIEEVVLIENQTSLFIDKQDSYMLTERAIDTPDIVEFKIRSQKNVDSMKRADKKASVFIESSNGELTSSSDRGSQTKAEKIIEKIYIVILTAGLVFIAWKYLTPSNQ